MLELIHLVDAYSRHGLCSAGILSEFTVTEGKDKSLPIYQFQWVYINCLPGVIFSMGLLYTALRCRCAKSLLYEIGLSYFPIYIWSPNRLHVQTINAPGKTFRVAKNLNYWLWCTTYGHTVDCIDNSLPSKIPSVAPRCLFTPPLPWEPTPLQHWIMAKVIRHFT